MPYPTLDINKIKKRCADDLDKFCDIYNIESIPEYIKFELYTNISDDSADEQFKIMKREMDKLINKITYISGKNIIDFDYAHDVVNLEDENQKNLWIIRTYIFYQLLIYLSLTLSNERLYNKVYDDKFKFRPEILNHLNDFKMGIFGSITPTSDIDIGIQYSPDEPNKSISEPALAYVVSRFSNCFLIFTEINMLKFDIEVYADMMTIPNTTENIKEYPDYFYLDSSNFTKKQFQKVLVCAGTSILRNAVLAEMDIRSPDKLSNKEINDIIDNFKIENILQIDRDFQNFYDNIKKELSDDWLSQGRNMVKDYLTSDYNTGRYKYYDLVNNAELSKFKGTATNEALMNLNEEKISDIMLKIGKSLTYRMESYNCAPTVMLVVRVLQASKKKGGDGSNIKKYTTKIPGVRLCSGIIQHLDPKCSIGYYGYILSCLEQLGYIYRFNKTYCQKETSHYNKNKCEKKMKKYKERYYVGIDYLKQEQETNTSGGRPIKKKRRKTIKRGSKKTFKRKYKKYPRKKISKKRKKRANNSKP